MAKANRVGTSAKPGIARHCAVCVDLDPTHPRKLSMSWLYLLVAAVLEIIWASGLKSTDGFTKLWPSVGVIAAMVASMFLLALAARGLPIGTAYAVWTGIGAVGTAIVGIAVFGESAATPRLLCMVLIIAGVAGLKFLAQ